MKYVDPSGHCKDEIKTTVNIHLLNNPNISVVAKKQLIKIISKEMGSSGSAFVAAPTYQPTDTGTITINGVTYKIFVPGYNDGTNSNFNSSGWVNAEGGMYTTTIKDYSYAKVGHDLFFSGWETEFYNIDVLKRSMVLEEDFHRDIQGKISGTLYSIK